MITSSDLKTRFPVFDSVADATVTPWITAGYTIHPNKDNLVLYWAAMQLAKTIPTIGSDSIEDGIKGSKSSRTVVVGGNPLIFNLEKLYNNELEKDQDVGLSANDEMSYNMTEVTVL